MKATPDPTPSGARLIADVPAASCDAVGATANRSVMPGVPAASSEAVAAGVAVWRGCHSSSGSHHEMSVFQRSANHENGAPTASTRLLDLRGCLFHLCCDLPQRPHEVGAGEVPGGLPQDGEPEEVRLDLYDLAQCSAL